MVTPIWIAQVEYRARQRWSAIRAAAFARRKNLLALLTALMPAVLLLMRHDPPKAPAPEPAQEAAAPIKPIKMVPAAEIVLVVHEYAAPAELPTRLVPVRPRLDVKAVENACSSEIGLLCNASKNDVWATVRCLKDRIYDLRPRCLQRLRPSEEVASRD